MIQRYVKTEIFLVVLLIVMCFGKEVMTEHRVALRNCRDLLHLLARTPTHDFGCCELRIFI